MSEPKNLREAVITLKAGKLVESVVSFSKELPKSELYELRTRLRHCIMHVPENIEKSFKECKKIERLRRQIMASTYLDECRDYLQLIRNLNYGETGELIREVDEITKMLNNGYANA